MKRAIRVSVFVSILTLTAGLTEASAPPIQGRVFGLELCPQFICGSAIFSGFFQGRIGLNPFAAGSVTVSIKHDPLPDFGDPDAAITGGHWELQTGLRRFSGYVDKGALHNNGDNTFNVAAVLVLTSGGSGSVNFIGRLNHNVFPPTVDGYFY